MRHIPGASQCFLFSGEPGTGPDTGSIAETGRLFLRNLPYQATEADLAGLFEEYGELSEVHLILDRSCHQFLCCLNLHGLLVLSLQGDFLTNLKNLTRRGFTKRTVHKPYTTPGWEANLGRNCSFLRRFLCHRIPACYCKP